MGFADVIATLKTILENGGDLRTFCQQSFKKGLTVRKAFRRRTEISIGELPIVLITRPTRKSEDNLNRRRDNRHTVRTYTLFRQEDCDLAAEQLIELDEMLVDAVLADPTQAGLAISTDFIESANDEGESHPVYAMVHEFEILTRS